MQAHLTQLKDLIDRLADAHGRLAELLVEQRDAMRRFKLDAEPLRQVAARLQDCVAGIGQLERQRRTCCDQLAGLLGLRAGVGAEPGRGGVRLSTLTARLQGPAGRPVVQAVARLNDQIQRVRQQERVNHKLADKLRTFFGELMGQIARMGRDTGCYDGAGHRALAAQPILAAGFVAVG